MEKEKLLLPEKHLNPNQFLRAWKITTKLFGNIWALLITAIFVFAAGSGIYSLWKGLEEMMNEIPAAVSWGLLALPIAFFSIYLINLVRALYVISREQLKVIRKLENELSPERISARISLSAQEYDQPHDDRYNAAVRVTNENQRDIVVYGSPGAIFHEDDGFEENLIDRINYYQSSKLTWRGGDSSKGRKTIPPYKHHDLNIAYVKANKIIFLFRKESPYDAKRGIYKVQLQINGEIGDHEIQEISFIGRLEYVGGGRLTFREWVEGDEEETTEEEV